ncbi:hypothetical protein [Kineococcus sp. SYSU DK005]|uniref:hypothetical protein n=1 Tax=Kineococcus sp. SYSU DK005 TaxID=3383126 RepID=UPI003D7D855A
MCVALLLLSMRHTEPLVVLATLAGTGAVVELNPLSRDAGVTGQEFSRVPVVRTASQLRLNEAVLKAATERVMRSSPSTWAARNSSATLTATSVATPPQCMSLPSWPPADYRCEDVVARTDGDELAIVMPGCRAEATAQRARLLVEEARARRDQLDRLPGPVT